MRKIVMLAPTEEAKQKIDSVLGEEIEAGRLMTYAFRHSTFRADVKECMEKGAQAIIARGGTYRSLCGFNLGIPIVNIGVGVADIVEAILQGKKQGRIIYLLFTDRAYLDLQEWEKNLDVTIYDWHYDEIEQLDEMLPAIAQKDGQAVVVGGSEVVRKAGEMGLKHVFAGHTVSSIMETYRRTMDLLDHIEQEIKQVSLLNGILNNVTDAVLVLNNDRELEHYNAQFAEFFPEVAAGSPREVLERIRELSFLEVVFDGRHIGNQIVRKGNNMLAVTADPLIIRGHVRGVICTVQAVSRVQHLEAKLRHKLSEKGLQAKYRFSDIFTRDREMEQVMEQAALYARTENTIMIYGESGTGKELFAQSIHNASSRSGEPFVAVNCAALSESLLESEIFGYVEGAFTGAKKSGKQGLFELAHRGTIFLDEVNSIPMNIQAKILRVIEEKEVMRLGADYILPVDVRIVVATNESLEEMVRSGAFRKDLYYRLNVLEIHIPPLRDRRCDIIPLFLRFTGEKEDCLPAGLRSDLERHGWPGNVRELKNVAERYQALEGRMEHFNAGTDEGAASGLVRDDFTIDMKALDKTVELLVIRSLLDKGLTKNQVASILGISRTVLWRRLNEESMFHDVK